MTSYEERVSLLEFLYRKPGVNLPEFAEVAGNLEDLIRFVFDDLQRSKIELREQVSALQARNRELEAYAHMVAHDLKEPLTVLILTADQIGHVPNVTSEELKERLLQINSTAYEMKKSSKACCSSPK